MIVTVNHTKSLNNRDILRQTTLQKFSIDLFEKWTVLKKISAKFINNIENWTVLKNIMAY